MKKSIKILIGIGLGIAFIAMIYKHSDNLTEYIAPQEEQQVDINQKPFHDEADFYFKAGSNYLEVFDGKDFQPIYIKGVNLGLGKPARYPGEVAITKAEYKKWIENIADMNANTIRVYTIQSPAFYEALYEYNTTHDTPVYLMQGIWYDEEIIQKEQNVFNEQFMKVLKSDTEDIVDVLHGNCTIEKKPGHAGGEYGYDVSPYTIGWILGIESDAELVSNSNTVNDDKTTYNGTYLGAEDVSPFEVFWAEIGDFTLSYEMQKYQMQRPLSFANWPTADVLHHPSENMEKEDAVELTMEALKPTSKLKTGLFASYHIYPYYPNFMYTQENYRTYSDDTGKINTYKAYLEDIKAQHTMPVLVAEFGVPESKGNTHANPLTGFDQGNHDEVEQGKMDASMMQDIYDTGCAGGLVFTWQDEWFKRTWNTMDYTDSDRRAYWCDELTNEQHFGLLDFVPGVYQETAVLDGKSTEWNQENLLMENNQMKLYVKHDAAYLYFMLEGNENIQNKKIILPIDSTPKSGSKKFDSCSFKLPADFLVVLDGKEDSTVLVQDRYNRYKYEYSYLEKNIAKNDVSLEEIPEPDIDSFSPIYLLLEKQLQLPDSGEVIPLEKYDVGHMKYGTTDYNSEEYCSIADFYGKDNIIELRIPWLLLNFRDPSSKEIEDDFYQKEGFTGMHIDDINIGMVNKDGVADMKPYQWETWDEKPYFERLKKSYYILQEQFKELEIK